MGITGTLLGKTTVLKYQVLFDKKDKVSVKVEPLTTPIKREYCKLYFLYLAKIIYNFGGRSANSSMIALGSLLKILESEIEPNTNCFEIAEVDDVIAYSEKVSKIITELSGTFYAWRNGNRTIDTKFPLNVTEQQTVYGGLALLQFAINENKKSKDNLIFIQRAGEMIARMYDSFDGSRMQDIVGIPSSIFLKLEAKRG